MATNVCGFKLPSGATSSGPWGTASSYLWPGIGGTTFSSSHKPFTLTEALYNYNKTAQYCLLYFFHDYELYGASTFTPTITATISNDTLASIDAQWASAAINSSVTSITDRFTAPAILGSWGGAGRPSAVAFSTAVSTPQYRGLWLKMTPKDASYGTFTVSLSVSGVYQDPA
jgi:hypothetical protein